MAKTRFTAREIREHLGISEPTFYRLRRMGAPGPVSSFAFGNLYSRVQWVRWYEDYKGRERPPVTRNRPKRETKPRFTHGTIYGYRKGCGCKKCRAANADYQARYRARKKARNG